MDYDSKEKVFPSKHDASLWAVTLAYLNEKYPERVIPEHARWAFEAACEELEDYLTLKNFIRRVATKWLWQRPSLPRGVGGMQGWREIKPVNLPDDE